MKKYVWTKKTEDKARKLGLEERKEGNQAMVGYDKLLGGLTATAWLEKGYVEVLDV